MKYLKDLTIYETIFLLAILRLKEEAYGVTIKTEVSKIKGRKISYGTIYSYLDQLSRKDLVIKKIGDPTSARGGRSKIYYTLSVRGIKALKAAHKLQKSIWDDTSAILDQV